ncbi:hypothetical protein LCGC14_3140140 [marine sediment metagenome]|uniref:Uncharacterized protein n=1 Tax=marine sediment metagenome TaxID=412755 RepID=A0A0F8VX90_9ZZZZ
MTKFIPTDLGKIVKDQLDKIERFKKILTDVEIEDRMPMFIKHYKYPKNKNKKVIVSTRHCSCADNNTHIFILEKDFCGWTKFRCATVWSKANNRGGYKTKDGWHYWGDDRDVKTPSLNTYRKRDFYFGYYDCRDKGHCFLYEDHGKKVGRAEKASWSECEIQNALWTLKTNLEVLE